MENYISGIAFWNAEAQKWQDSCLPITMKRSLIPTKIRTTNRAKSFGLTAIGNWQTKGNIHHRDFQTEFGEIRRAFIIPKS